MSLLSDKEARGLVSRLENWVERVVATYEGRLAFDREQEAAKRALNERYVAAQELAAKSEIKFSGAVNANHTTNADP